MSAIISDCGRYRYRLDRPGEPGQGKTAIIMVNPSTADAVKDDATIRKLKGFGERYRWGDLIIGNLFAFRAKEIAHLRAAQFPVGPENDERLLQIFAEADRVIYAWGALAKQPLQLRWRWRVVDAMASKAGLKPLCLGEPLADGHPRHPVMAGYDKAPRLWSAPR